MRFLKPAIITLVFLAILFYLKLPVLNFGFSKIAVYLILGVLVFEALQNLSSLKGLRIWKDGKLQGFRGLSFNNISKWILGLSLIYVLIVNFITTTPLFHSARYQKLLGDVTKGVELNKQLSPIPLDKIRTVDQELAELLGDKVLGNQVALGSKVNLGVFNIQKVGDQFFWVAPLIHSGFFKWWNNKAGCNGYVMVNACNERDVRLVQDLAGNPVWIKYQQGAYFNDYLPRHLYMNGIATSGITDYTFELDDSGKPYWVVTLYKKTIGFSGNDATGIAVVDAGTGAIEKYDLSNVPLWVDRVQPEDFIYSQINDWGEYINGYFNFSNEGKLQASNNPLLVYGNDNESYWYTSLTSVGKDESTVGFALVNTRTKESVWYPQGGATPNSARQSAEGKVQEKGYFATEPIPCNINNIPTYVISLKDNGGLVKMYAMVSIADYTIVGVGNNLQETLMGYKNAYNSSGTMLNKQNALSTDSVVHQVVNRINADVKNGNTYYYFTLQNSNTIFMGSSLISSELPLTQVGDSVKISFTPNNQSVIDITTFENMGLEK
jgi:hypothetical protein